ncbi:hypothetical protein IJI18_01075 [Candidatus Saccharibacteria bacterium]|nr:hypothetical protein [Candidatus Saccharibacteria bacterium]
MAARKGSMGLYHKINQQIKQQNISTITLDIFDTVLLRKIWPEDLQFLKVAQKWTPIFRQIFSKHITADELYSYRIYARKELIAIHKRYNRPSTDSNFSLENLVEYDVNLDSWFSQIIDLISTKYQVKLTSNQKTQILRSMIKIELETEKQFLIPNYKIINIVKKLKNRYPRLKVFFVSDMYLTSENLKILFDHFKIDIFDGGITSTEAKHTKATGKLYDFLHESKILDQNFDISYNLHIGDSEISDVKNAVLSGGEALLYKKVRLRKIRTNMGRLKMKTICKKIVRKDQKLLTELHQRNLSTFTVWQHYGILFAQPLFIYLQHLLTAAKESPNTTFLMVSSEANIFKKYGELLNSDFSKQSNIVVADKLNRRCVIRAIIWALIKDKNLEFSPEVIMKIVGLGEVDGSRRDFYDFVFGRNYPYSEIATNYRSDEHFFKAFLKEVAKADPKYTKALRASYIYAKSFLPKHQSDKIVIVDAGWGGTVQVLFSQFANLHGYRQEIDGLYIGVMPGNRFGVRDMPPMEGYLMPDVKYGKDRSLFCAVLWEYPYTSKPQFSGDIAHLEQIRIGLEKGIELFRHTTGSPRTYYDQTIRKEIKRLVAYPTMTEAKNLGSIEFDMGFANPASFRIVDMGLTRKWVLTHLIVRPKWTVKNVIFAQNHWAGGFIRYYKIPFVRPLVKLYGKLVKKTLI